MNYCSRVRLLRQLSGHAYSNATISTKPAKSDIIVNKNDVLNGVKSESAVKFPSSVRVAPLTLMPRVVIYDGVCHLCNAGVNWIIRLDKYNRISFCAVQSRIADPYLLACGLSREDVLRRFVFIEGPNSYHQGSTAALKIASYLPFPYATLSVFLFIPAPVRDFIYDFVADNRYHWFGRTEKCIVPSDEVLDKFIDKEEMLEQRLKKEQFEEDAEV